MFCEYSVIDTWAVWCTFQPQSQKTTTTKNPEKKLFFQKNNLFFIFWDECWPSIKVKKNFIPKDDCWLSKQKVADLVCQANLIKTSAK